MLMRGWALTTLALGLLLATAPWASGQVRHDGDEATNPEESEITIYRLEYADCKSVASVISGLSVTPSRVLPDPSTNSLIVRTDRGGREQVEQLLAKLDVPPQESTRVTEFLPLKYRDAEGVARLINNTATSHIKIAVDEATQAIIMTGRPSDIAAAREIVARVDKPQRALTLSFYFVQGTIGDGEDGGAEALPPALKGVAPALSNGGFTDMTLLAPMTTAVQAGSEFTTAGFLQVGGGGKLLFEIEGEVHESATAESAQFTLGAHVAKDLSGDSINIFHIETTLTARLGDYVVLAAAPAQNGENQAVALIVRVD